MANSQFVAKALPKVMPCSCAHEYQDRKFGKGRRLCNPTMKMSLKDRVTTYRCTVCGSLRS